MLYRKFYETLRAWKKDGCKKALLVDGARQIGKTTLIRRFAADFYGKNVLEINFIASPEAREIFAGERSAVAIVMKMTAWARRELTPQKTLIFLDEIQECPEARTAIKFLVEDGRFDYIESGSLLGVTYQRVPSLPVGFEEAHTMYPLDLEEFALAMQVQPSTFTHIRTCYDERSVVDEFVHEQMMKLVGYYLAVGGMPRVVQEFVSSNDMGKVARLQREILVMYRQDIQKYADQKRDKITMIFDTIPAELNNRNKRFVLSDLAKSARSERYESCFNWLSDAGVTLPCYNLQEMRQPVAVNQFRNLFKLYLADTGLLCAMCSEDVQFRILNGGLGVNEGGILENFFAQQLKANGYALYYFDNKNIGEIDFVLEHDGTLLPLEIKSGGAYRKHRALDRLLESPDCHAQEAIVFSGSNVARDGQVAYLPVYMAMYLKRAKKLGKVDVRLGI